MRERQVERLHHLLFALLFVLSTVALYRFVTILLTRLPWLSVALPS